MSLAEWQRSRENSMESNASEAQKPILHRLKLHRRLKLLKAFTKKKKEEQRKHRLQHQRQVTFDDLKEAQKTALKQAWKTAIDDSSSDIKDGQFLDPRLLKIAFNELGLVGEPEQEKESIQQSLGHNLENHHHSNWEMGHKSYCH